MKRRKSEEIEIVGPYALIVWKEEKVKEKKFGTSILNSKERLEL
jgi:hypothetical protein